MGCGKYINVPGKLVVNKVMKQKLVEAGLWDDADFVLMKDASEFWDDAKKEKSRGHLPVR